MIIDNYIYRLYCIPQSGEGQAIDHNTNFLGLETMIYWVQ